MPSRILVLAAFVLPCCAVPQSTPTKYDVDNSDIGTAPALDVCRLAAQAYTLPGLKDPASARFTFGGLVERDVFKTGHLKGKVAWRYGFTVMSKDESGLYVGPTRRAVWFANDQAIALSAGDPGREQAMLLPEPVTLFDIRLGAPHVFNQYGYTPAP